MSSFPTSLDTLDDKTDAVDYPQAADINNLNDAVEKLEAKVGIDSSAVATSIDYLLKNTTGGHDHDGSDSKKVVGTNIDVTGLTASQLLRVNSGGSAIESSGKVVPTGTIVGTSDEQTLTNKTLTSPVLNTTVSGTAVLDEDDMASNSATKLATQQSIKAYIDAKFAGAWPIGSIFISIVSTNPATLLGFGTWTAFATGRTLVGIDSGDVDFDTVEETSGSKTVTLTGAQSGIAAHLHTVNPPATATGGQSATHTHLVNVNIDDTVGDGYPTSGGNQSQNQKWQAITGAPSNDHAHTVDIAQFNSGTVAAANAAGAHSNVQPSIVTYMWKRTA